MSVPGPDDTRGIVDPEGMRTVATLERYPPGEALEGLVEWFWAVAWQVPPGGVHVQKVLTHPASHLSVGTLDRAGRVLSPAGARVYGVTTRLDERRLVGRGWTVAARTTGGLGVLVGRPAHTLAEAEVPMAEAIGVRDVAARVGAAAAERDRVDVLRSVLERVAGSRDPEALAAAREVSAIAAVAERDRDVVRVEQLAALAGVGVRTLQRMFAQHLGISPSWVIRRWRIVEAADVAAQGDDVGWADLAADLGYADQSHLVRDFRAHLGTTPTAYARSASARTASAS